jgi:hypothetical protein
MLRLLAPVLICALACDFGSIHRAASAQPPAEPRLIYAAALGDTDATVASRNAALGLDLLSDRGTYTSSRNLSESVTDSSWVAGSSPNSAPFGIRPGADVARWRRSDAQR